jgi:hypothetical protein
MATPRLNELNEINGNTLRNSDGEGKRKKALSYSVSGK